MKKSIKLASSFLMAFALVAFMTPSLFAQATMGGKTCLGVWKTVDDESGKTKSHVEIYEKGGKYFGKIIKLLHTDAESLKAQGLQAGEYSKVKCSECPAEYGGKNQTVEGVEIIKDMEKYSNKYGGGTIMDPKKGKVYTCTMWLESADQLKVRGWVAMFYRTQTWYRVK